uniref:BTB domain-containing protein n=1 Tax=Electrophorus electricus TaxID=8005 RepID=A0AAY5F4U1_ELEEL
MATWAEISARVVADSYFLMFSKSHGDGVLSRYQNLRMAGRMCDVALEAEGKEFPAHRALLACSSDYFWSLFQEHTLESRVRAISLSALSSTGLEQVLDFIYTSWISLSPCTLEDTLEAACYLQVTHAVDLCARYISDGLSLDNCCFFANVAARYGLSEALTVTNHFIAFNMAKLLGTSRGRTGLLELNLDSFREVLGSEEIPGVEEVAMLHLALDWLGSNTIATLESNSLLSRVRFGLIPPRELSRLGALKPALRTPFIHSLVQKHSRKFRPLSVAMPKKLQHQGVCVVGNFLFVIGGEQVEVDEEMWRYDPRFERWEEMEPLLQRRAQFSCCVVEGVIYAIGGRGQRGEPALSSVERYNMRAGCWRSGPPLPNAIHGQACATVGTGVYISGGIHGTQSESSKEVLFLNTSGPAAWKRRAAMSIARFGHQMATIKEYIYTFLGMYEPFCDIERYDPEQNQWTRLKPLLQDRFCYGLTVSPGGHVLGKKQQNRL